MYIYHIFIVRSSVEGYLGCFYSLLWIEWQCTQLSKCLWSRTSLFYCCDKTYRGNLYVKEFTLTYSSRRPKSIMVGHHGKVAGMVGKTGSWKLPFWTTSTSKERKLKVRQGFKLSKPTSNTILPPSKLHILSIPKWYHQLGDKYSNTWVCGRAHGIILIQTTRDVESFEHIWRSSMTGSCDVILAFFF